MSSAERTHPLSKHEMPRHVAIIMDGNGRWAQQRGKSRIAGHRAGIKAVQRSIRFAVQQGVPALTLYAFSCENWQRPQAEVSALLALFSHVLIHYVEELDRYNVRLQFIGDKARFSDTLRTHIAQAEALTAHKTGLVLTIAANYSGHWDIIQAVRQLSWHLQQADLTPDHIDETVLARYLSLHDLPAVDLMIRTSGEYRLSNFLLWQVAYAELYFTDVLWPDFNEDVFSQALQTFAQRERRFGTVKRIDSSLQES